MPHVLGAPSPCSTSAWFNWACHKINIHHQLTPDYRLVCRTTNTLQRDLVCIIFSLFYSSSLCLVPFQENVSMRAWFKVVLSFYSQSTSFQPTLNTLHRSQTNCLCYLVSLFQHHRILLTFKQICFNATLSHSSHTGYPGNS